VSSILVITFVNEYINFARIFTSCFRKETEISAGFRNIILDKVYQLTQGTLFRPWKLKEYLGTGQFTVEFLQNKSKHLRLFCWNISVVLLYKNHKFGNVSSKLSSRTHTQPAFVLQNDSLTSIRDRWSIILHSLFRFQTGNLRYAISKHSIVASFLFLCNCYLDFIAVVPKCFRLLHFQRICQGMFIMSCIFV
jgi:hypothetical protein